MAQIESIRLICPGENELLQGCNVGSSYKENQGVINVYFAENIETPPDVSEEDIEAHIMGIVLIENFNMKKGVDIFGDRSKTAVMKELQKIHDMNTYKPMDMYTLTFQERKDALDSLIFIIEERNGETK